MPASSSRTAFRIGAWIWFCLFALALPAVAQWRTGYFLQGEAAGQTAATIPWSKYTHVIHSGLLPTFSTGVCSLDAGFIRATDVTAFVTAAHAAGVKAIIGISEDDTLEAITACTAPQNIPQFVDLVRTFVANSGYDGVDLDWERRIIAPQYQDLVRRLRKAMPTATLSVAVGIAERFTTAAVQYDLDQINIRAYRLESQDLAGNANNQTWYRSPTLQGANTQDQAMDIVSWSYVYAGNASSKLGLAVPFYGRIRKGCLNDNGTNGVTDPNQAWVGRAEISSILYRDLVNSTYWNAGTRVWDDSRNSQYIQYRGGGCANDAFIPYPGPEQLQEIVSLIRANNLGGIATYSLPYEYIATQDGDARYPLSTAIDDAMRATVSSESVISKRSALAAMPSSALANKAAMDAPPTPTPPSITSPLPTALNGAPYSQTVTAAGTAPIAWSVTGGALPAGLVLGSSTGIINGMPTAQGVFTLTVTASNAVGSNSQQLSLTVNSVPLIVTTSPLPSAMTGTAYSQTLAATGTTPMTWTITGGALPSGLTLGASTGTISGTPSAVGVFTVTVTATNAIGSNTQQLSLTMNAPTPPLILTTSPLPAAPTGTAYSQTLTATGTTPLAWTVTSGALPSGLTLGSSTGTISGTPTAVGAFTPTVTATNVGGSNSKQVTLTVNAPPTPPSIVTTSPLPAALTGAAYSQTLTATSATPMTWIVTGGALPSGLTLGSSTGTISGMPTALGVFTPTVTATNAGGANSKLLSLTVNAPLTESGTFTYYVDSANGSDSNPGTLAAPWKTIARINATKLAPGQSVGFKRGGVWREQLTVPSSGSAGQPITFGAYGTGAKPFISGADVATGWTSETITNEMASLQQSARNYNTFHANLGNLSSQGRKAQRFVVGAVGISVDQITLWGEKVGSPTDNLTVSLFTETSSHPGTSLGTSNTVAGSGLNGTSTGALITFNFSTPVSLSASTAYWIVVDRTGALDGSNYYTLNGDGSYAGGGVINGTAAPSSWANGGLNNSLYFTVYAAMSTSGYYKTFSTQPNQIFSDGSRLGVASSKSALGFGQQWRDDAGGKIYIRLSGGDDPARHTIEASQRDFVIYLNGKNYITVDGIDLRRANTDNLRIDGATNTVVVQNTVNSDAYAMGNHVRYPGIGTAVKEYITFDSNTITGCGAVGISAADYSNHVTITRNVVSYCASLDTDPNYQFNGGIRLIGTHANLHDVLIDGNTTTHNGTTVHIGKSGVFGTGIWADTVGANIVISRNLSCDNVYYGFQNENTDGAILFANLACRNWSGIIVDASGNTGDSASSRNNLTYNNTVYGNRDVGIRSKGSYTTGPVAGSCINNRMENNISVGNGTANFAAVFGGENDGTYGSGNVYLYNDFGPKTTNFIGWGIGSFLSTYAAWESAVGNCGTTGCSHSMQQDPLFTSIAVDDFSLQPGSPATGAGIYIPGFSTSMPPNIGAK